MFVAFSADDAHAICADSPWHVDRRGVFDVVASHPLLGNDPACCLEIRERGPYSTAPAEHVFARCAPVGSVVAGIIRAGCWDTEGPPAWRDEQGWEQACRGRFDAQDAAPLGDAIEAVESADEQRVVDRVAIEAAGQVATASAAARAQLLALARESGWPVNACRALALSASSDPASHGDPLARELWQLAAASTTGARVVSCGWAACRLQDPAVLGITTTQRAVFGCEDAREPPRALTGGLDAAAVRGDLGALQRAGRLDELRALVQLLPRSLGEGDGAAEVVRLNLNPGVTRDALVGLAVQYQSEAYFDEAAAAYELLQDRWPLHPDNPSHQREVVLLWRAARVVEPGRVQRALERLATSYARGSAWYAANRSDLAALARADAVVRPALESLAEEALATAVVGDDVDAYAVAVDHYRRLVEGYPEGEASHQERWYLAFALVRSERLDDALPLLADLASDAGGAYAEEALVSRVRWLARALPPLERRAGEPRERRPAGGRFAAFLAAWGALSAHELADPDLAASFETDRPHCMYLAAQIRFELGHDPEAREGFEAVRERYPESDVAAFAAGYLAGMSGSRR
jgi:hypothetical protein